MKKLCFGLLVALLFGSNSCNHKAQEQTAASQAPAVEKKGIDIKLSQLASNKDFNCDMTLEEGSIADTASYQGKLYGFCSSECKAEFLKDPQSHLTQK